MFSSVGFSLTFYPCYCVVQLEHKAPTWKPGIWIHLNPPETPQLPCLASPRFDVVQCVVRMNRATGDHFDVRTQRLLLDALPWGHIAKCLNHKSKSLSRRTTQMPWGQESHDTHWRPVWTGLNELSRTSFLPRQPTREMSAKLVSSFWMVLVALIKTSTQEFQRDCLSAQVCLGRIMECTVHRLQIYTPILDNFNGSINWEIFSTGKGS